MSLALTPGRVAAVYECLREFPPLNRCRLPRATEIEFGVTEHVDQHADVDVVRDWKRLRVSSKMNGHFNTVAQSVAHEMVHLALHARGVRGWETHGADFQALARRVCRNFGWDLKVF